MGMTGRARLPGKAENRFKIRCNKYYRVAARSLCTPSFANMHACAYYFHLFKGTNLEKKQDLDGFST